MGTIATCDSSFVLNHYAVRGVMGSKCVLASPTPTSTTESNRRVPPPRGSLLAALVRGAPFFVLRLLPVSPLRGVPSCRGGAASGSGFGSAFPSSLCTFHRRPRLSAGCFLPEQTDVPSRLRSTSSLTIVSGTSPFFVYVYRRDTVYQGART